MCGGRGGLEGACSGIETLRLSRMSCIFFLVDEDSIIHTARHKVARRVQADRRAIRLAVWRTDRHVCQLTFVFSTLRCQADKLCRQREVDVC